mgnify:CR=1 FL=1
MLNDYSILFSYSMWIAKQCSTLQIQVDNPFRHFTFFSQVSKWRCVLQYIYIVVFILDTDHGQQYGFQQFHDSGYYGMEI